MLQKSVVAIGNVFVEVSPDNIKFSLVGFNDDQSKNIFWLGMS